MHCFCVFLCFLKLNLYSLTYNYFNFFLALLQKRLLICLILQKVAGVLKLKSYWLKRILKPISAVIYRKSLEFSSSNPID
jgi:hypothetical protein